MSRRPSAIDLHKSPLAIFPSKVRAVLAVNVESLIILFKWLSALVMFNNEYNDSGYDISVKLILVYDAEGNELVPNKENSVKAREEQPELSDFIYERQEDCDYSEDGWLDNLVVELRK